MEDTTDACYTGEAHAMAGMLGWITEHHYRDQCSNLRGIYSYVGSRSWPACIAIHATEHTGSHGIAISFVCNLCTQLVP